MGQWKQVNERLTHLFGSKQGSLVFADDGEICDITILVPCLWGLEVTRVGKTVST